MFLVLVFIFFMVLVFSLVLVLVFYFFMFLAGFKLDYLSKVSSFERGFIRLIKIQNSFRIHFFVIILIFVIFDLEVVMFLGLLVSDVSSIFGFFFLLVFVLCGFYMEWGYGKLVWMI